MQDAFASLASSTGPTAVVSSDGQPFVFTTQVQDRGGLTNGYYLGRPGAVAGIMDRFRYARPGHEPFRNYEHLLLRAFQDSGTARRVTDQVFFKVRASGDVHWLEPRGAAMLRLPCSTRSDVWDEFQRAKQLAFRLWTGPTIASSTHDFILTASTAATRQAGRDGPPRTASPAA